MLEGIKNQHAPAALPQHRHVAANICIYFTLLRCKRLNLETTNFSAAAVAKNS